MSYWLKVVTNKKEKESIYLDSFSFNNNFGTLIKTDYVRLNTAIYFYPAVLAFLLVLNISTASFSFIKPTSVNVC